MTDVQRRATSARENILAKIRDSNRSSSGAPAASEEWSAIKRCYQYTARRERADILALFIERLRDYDAIVSRLRRAELRDAVARTLTARGLNLMVIPHGLSAVMLPKGFSFVVDCGSSAAELDRYDGVLTESSVAIAETGTIVLQNVAGQGRRALTLVPDFHLCIVRAADVVETVPEAMAKLQSTAILPTTFISGPSATADIEMTRIKGVHGPRSLEVILVEDEPPASSESPGV